MFTDFPAQPFRRPGSCLGMHLFGGKFCTRTDGTMRSCTCPEVLRSRQNRARLVNSSFSTSYSSRHLQQLTKSTDCVCARKNFDYFLAALVTVFQVKTLPSASLLLFSIQKKIYNSPPTVHFFLLHIHLILFITFNSIDLWLDEHIETLFPMHSRVRFCGTFSFHSILVTLSRSDSSSLRQATQKIIQLKTIKVITLFVEPLSAQSLSIFSCQLILNSLFMSLLALNLWLRFSQPISCSVGTIRNQTWSDLKLTWLNHPPSFLFFLSFLLSKELFS